MQQFDMGPWPVQKNEYFTTCGIAAKLCANQATKPVKCLAHITAALIKKIAVR